MMKKHTKSLSVRVKDMLPFVALVLVLVAAQAVIELSSTGLFSTGGKLISGYCVGKNWTMANCIGYSNGFVAEYLNYSFTNNTAYLTFKVTNNNTRDLYYAAFQTVGQALYPPTNIPYLTEKYIYSVNNLRIDNKNFVQFTLEDCRNQENCTECKDEIIQFTLMYIGNTTSRIKVVQSNYYRTVFDGTVAPGEEFTFAGTGYYNSFGYKVTLYVNGIYNTAIYTDCWRPNSPGMITGDFEITGAINRHGENVCAIGKPNTNKTSTLIELKRLSSTNTGAQKDLTQAVKHLSNSLYNRRIKWLDESHVACMSGGKVFDEEKCAVKKLMKISDPADAHYDAAIANKTTGLASNVVNVDRLLASTLIEDIRNDTRKDAVEFGKALDELAKGDQERIAGIYDSAITHYKEAWKHAMKSSYYATNRIAAYDYMRGITCWHSYGYCDFKWEESECDFSDGDYDTFTYAISVSDFFALKNITVLLKAKDKSATIIFKNPCTSKCVDNDGDGYNVTGEGCGPVDCNDDNALVYPGATEICNNIDDNCNGQIDESLTRQTACGLGACAGNTGYETCNAGVWGQNTCNPYAGASQELCDAYFVDEDCDGTSNENCTCTAGQTRSCYEGPDGTENVGICHAGTQTCSMYGQWGSCTGAQYPEDEICDNLDNDCNSTTPDGSAEDWYNEPTHCGIGACADNGHLTCSAGTKVDTCSPGSPSTEICNHIDDDCDSQTDEGVLLTFYADFDSDDYGNASQAEQACTAPSGYVSDDTDCDDTDSAINPGQEENCTNGIDDDCNELADFADPYCILKLPVVSIVSPRDGSNFKYGYQIVFSASASDDKNITSYRWYSSRDGLFGTSMTLTYSNLSIGTHIIKINVTDSDGFTSSYDIEITIKPIYAPAASILTPSNGDTFKKGTSIMFSGIGSDTDGTIVAYSWNSSIDGIIGTTANFNASNLSVGSHEIILTVTDDDGLTSSDSIAIEVKELGTPVASITSPDDMSDFKISTPITFAGTGYDSDGYIVSYDWESDIDGTIGSSSSFTRSDLSPGLHEITLTVTDDDGLTSSNTIHITVKQLNAPSVSISSPDEGDSFVQGQGILFSATGSDADGYITSWQWSSSIDGLMHTDGAKNFSTFSYSNLSLGLHTITVTVTDDDNITFTDTFSIDIKVNPEYAPTGSIVAPLDGSQYRQNQTITLSGYGTDVNGNITSYEWYSSLDGLIGTGMTINTSSLSVGEHTITLIVTDNDGQTGSTSITLTVLDNDSPTASVTSPIDGSVFKLGDNIQFDGYGDKENITQYVWTSDVDGFLSNSSSFNTSSLSVGEHEITLTVIDDDGQSSSSTVTITVKAKQAPSASIVSPIDGTDYKYGQTVTFAGTGSDTDGYIASYYWASDIDGVIGNTSSFGKSNLSLGSHTITLIVTDDDGLTASDSVQIVIKQLKAPTVSIVSPNDGDNFIEDQAVLFSAIGSDSDGYITSWQWTSSIDGLMHTDGAQNVSTFSYSGLSIGRHLITVMATDNDNVTFVDTFSIDIEVNPEYAPAGSIISPLDGSQYRQGQSILLSGYGTDIKGNITSYEWYSSLDGFIGTGMTINTSSLSVGEHTVTLVVTNNNNQTGTTSITLTVLDNDSPTSSIISPTDGSIFKSGDNVQFSGYGDNEVITQYIWTSDLDGFLSNESSFNASSLSVGEHEITLTVIDNDGQSSSSTVTITVKAKQAPSASIASPIDGTDYKRGQVVTFNGIGSDSDGYITSYYWTSDIDGVIGNESSFSTSNLSLGLHTITFTVTDNDGLTASDETKITIKALQAPTVSVISPNSEDNFKEGNTILFSATGSDSDGYITSWQWSSNIDGLIHSDGTQNFSTFSYSNLSLGLHTITVTVTDSDNLTYVDTFSVLISINPELAPTGSIVAPLDGSQYRQNQTITLSGYGTDVNGNITGYEWYSSLDGLIGTGMTINTSSLSVGEHTITLTVIDDDGQTSSSSITLTVLDNDAPTASVTSPIDGSVFKSGNMIQFNGYGDNEVITQYIWTSNIDGLLSNSSSFNTSSLSVGEHTITLTVIDNDGQSSSSTITITVAPKQAPSASIVSPIDGTDYKRGQTVTFAGTGSDTDGYIASYYWASDIDGVIGNSQSFSTSNLSLGLHTITLIVTDDDGLASSESVQVTVKQLKAPIASITSPNDYDNFVDEQNILFSAIGSDTDGYITSWQWSSSIDGLIHSDGAQNFSTFSYGNLSLGLHTITVVVTDDDNLTYVDTFSISININPALAPTCSIISPLDGSQYRQNQTITLSGYGTDLNGNITSYEWYSSLDGLIGTGMTVQTSALSVGKHTITLVVKDNSNQTSTSNIMLTVLDNNAPTASIISPGDYSVFGLGDSVQFSGYGDNDVIAQYIWTSNLDGFLSNSSSFDTSTLSMGEHRITLTVIDDDGQSSSSTVTIVVKSRTAPYASIISPIDGSDYKSGQNITFVGVGSDTDGYIASYYWASDIDGVIGTGSTFSTSDLSLGLHTITLIVTDDDGLTTFDEITVTVKAPKAPTASIIQPSDGDVFKKGSPIYFLGSGSDPDGTIISWLWTSSIDGVIGSNRSFTRSNLSLGRHDITLTVVDDDLNRFTDTYTIWILVDQVLAPNVTITSPTSNTVIKDGTNVHFDANVSSTTSIIAYNWASDIDGFLGSNKTFDTANLSIGYHTITLTATNSANLTSLDTIAVNVVPKLSPNVTMTSPTEYEFEEGSNITFAANITDDGTIASIVWNSDLDGNFGNSTNFTINSLTPGKHTITIIVTDDDNLTTTVQKTIVINPKYVCESFYDLHVEQITVPSIVYATYPVNVTVEMINQFNTSVTNETLKLYAESTLVSSVILNMSPYEAKNFTFTWTPPEANAGGYVTIRANASTRCDSDTLDNTHQEYIFEKYAVEKTISVIFLPFTGTEGFKDKYSTKQHGSPLRASYKYNITKITNTDNVTRTVNLTLTTQPPSGFGNGNGIDSFNLTSVGPIQVNVSANSSVKVYWPYDITFPNQTGFYDLKASVTLGNFTGSVSDTHTIEIANISSPLIDASLIDTPEIAMTNTLDVNDTVNISSYVSNDEFATTAVNETASLNLKHGLTTTDPTSVLLGDVEPCSPSNFLCLNGIWANWTLTVAEPNIYRNLVESTYCQDLSEAGCNVTKYKPDPREGFPYLNDLIIQPSRPAYLSVVETVSIIKDATTEVNANITNYGELDANDINVTLECNPSYFTIDTAPSQLVNVSNNSVAIVPFNVTGHNLGEGKTCKISINATNVSQDTSVPQIDIVTAWPTLSIPNIILNATQVYLGQTYRIMVNITNNGTGTANSVITTIYFNNTLFELVSGTNPINLTNLGPNQSVIVNFTLKAKALASSTTINITVVSEYDYANASTTLSIKNSCGVDADGNGKLCDPWESCSSCSSDCGACKPAGGGGGGGGGCSNNWSCGSWSSCYANNTQSRTCTDIGTCHSANKTEWQNCTQSIPEVPSVTPITPPAMFCSCPQDSNWSACVQGKHSKVSYTCSDVTNYTCIGKTVERQCELPAPAVITPYLNIVIPFTIALALALYASFRLRNRWLAIEKKKKKYRQSHITKTFEAFAAVFIVALFAVAYVASIYYGVSISVADLFNNTTQLIYIVLGVILAGFILFTVLDTFGAAERETKKKHR